MFFIGRQRLIVSVCMFASLDHGLMLEPHHPSHQAGAASLGEAPSGVKPAAVLIAMANAALADTI
jgi:hypothetical protein